MILAGSGTGITLDSPWHHTLLTAQFLLPRISDQGAITNPVSFLINRFLSLPLASNLFQ